MSIIVKSKDSLLTTSSGYTNYRGILNLVIILLVLSNTRVALENVIKYGILVDPLSWLLFFGEGSKHLPSLIVINGLGLHILVSLAIERFIAHLCYPNCSPKQQQSKTPTPNKSPASSPRKQSQQQQQQIVLAPNSSHENRQGLMYVANLALFINLIVCISLPPIIIYSHDTHPISTSGALMLVSIVFLKLVSYHMMNFWSRDVRRLEQHQSRTTKSFLKTYTPPSIEFAQLLATNANSNTNSAAASCSSDKLTKPNDDNNNIRAKLSSSLPNTPVATSTSASNAANTSVDRNSSGSSSPKSAATRRATLEALAKYPDNITLHNIFQYMLFPTLCYELEYARTLRIRKRFLIKRIVELIILSQLDMALVQQWIIPTVSNSVTPFRQMRFTHMLERLLKLAIPNHVIWVIWFYSFFHSLLNIIAELTRFADREFYRDWWNAESVYYFWSNWNIPVHKWCARHLYVPLMSLGWNKCQASTAVFFVSAFFHEYLVSVPLKMFRMWAFTGMLIQLPWARFVSSYFNSNFANVAVWVSLILGQPLCILMYYHDYYVINHVRTSSSPLR